jgi:hypothetical protein
VKLTFHPNLISITFLNVSIIVSYNKAVEVKNERTKASATKYGPKGGKQSVTPAQVCSSFATCYEKTLR